MTNLTMGSCGNTILLDFTVNPALLTDDGM